MLKDRLKADFKTAMKEKNAILKLVVADIRGAIQYAETRKGRSTKANDAEIISIINKCVKECNESIDACKLANYDYSEHEGKLAIFKTYLPEEASEEKITEIVGQVVAQLDATSMKDMGNVMKQSRTILTGAGLNFSGGMLADTVKIRLKWKFMQDAYKKAREELD